MYKAGTFELLLALRHWKNLNVVSCNFRLDYALMVRFPLVKNAVYSGTNTAVLSSSLLN